MHALRIGKSLHNDSFSFTQPQVAGRQIHKNNIQTSTVEQYSRISLYNDVISYVVSELESKFISNENYSFGLLCLLRNHICDAVIQVFNFNVRQKPSSAVKFYHQHDSTFHALFYIEYGMWVRKWKMHNSEVPHK